jgi:Sigma-70 region 2
VTQDQRVENLEQFLAQRGQALLRTAVLFTGSIEAGEDLLQSAIERLLRQGRRLDGDPEGYLRRTLCNLATDGYRRQGRWRRKLLILQAEAHAPADATAEVDLRTRWVGAQVPDDGQVRGGRVAFPDDQPVVCPVAGWDAPRPSPTDRRRTAALPGSASNASVASSMASRSWPDPDFSSAAQACRGLGAGLGRGISAADRGRAGGTRGAGGLR